MKILLTGATGFIGSAFLGAATANGHEVAALVRPGKTPPPRENVTWIPGTLQAPSWRDIEMFAPEACVHSAWIATPGIYLESPENELWVEWSSQFLNKLQTLGIRHTTVLGTCIEYHISNAMLSEESTPIAPTSLYARCKHRLHVALQNELKVPLAWGRVFYPYGPGEHPARLASSLVHKLSNDEKVTLKTPSSTKDYIFIDDLAAAMLAAVENRFAGAINLGTGNGTTIREIAQTVAEELGKSTLVEEVCPEAPDPLGYVVADAQKLRSLGWSPKVSLRDGLKKLIASIQTKRNI